MMEKVNVLKELSSMIYAVKVTTTNKISSWQISWLSKAEIHDLIHSTHPFFTLNSKTRVLLRIQSSFCWEKAELTGVTSDVVCFPLWDWRIHTLHEST